MKTFNHVGAASDLAELKTQNVEGQRFYKSPSGKWYPSVTTVVGKQSIEGIKKWEQRIGYMKAEKIRRQSAWRGRETEKDEEEKNENENEGEAVAKRLSFLETTT